jgi:hypothetical protein
MFRFSILAAAFLIGFDSPVLAWAQAAGPSPSSLEKDYANLCAGRPEPASETCEALRQALIAKLGGASLRSATASQGPAAAPAPTPAAPDELHSRWGLYADMVGKSYFDRFTSGEPSGISIYKWNTPGIELEVTRYGATPMGGIKPDKECVPFRIIRRFDPGTNKITRKSLLPCWPELAEAEVVIQPDGSSVETEIPRTTGPKAFRGKYRDLVNMRKNGTVRSMRQERKRDGSYKDLGFGTTISHERTPEYLAAVRAEQERLARGRATDSGSSGLLGAAVRGLAMGFSGVDAPLMNADGSEVNTLDVLNAAGAELARKNVEGRAQLDATIAQANGQASSSDGGLATSSSAAAAPARSQSHQGGSATRMASSTAYLLIGIRPTDKNTRNPMCYSTPFQITYQSEENHWGDAGRAEAAAMQYRGQFEAACSRLGVLEGRTNPVVQRTNPSFVLPSITQEDFQVPIP